MDTTLPNYSVHEIFTKLNGKFENNLNMCLGLDCDKLRGVELKARYIAALGQILREEEHLLQSQQHITTIFDEIFADLIISVYFAGCSLDKPAQMVLRRVLEMGVSVVYLWDLPHEFWGWKCHDKDLQFKTMVDHISRDNYKTFIKSIHTQHNPEEKNYIENVTKLYRDLSNTTHGKISTFETSLPDRFSHTSTDWGKHLDNVEKVQDLLIGLFNMRFFDTCHELNEKMPPLKIK